MHFGQEISKAITPTYLTFDTQCSKSLKRWLEIKKQILMLILYVIFFNERYSYTFKKEN